MASIYSRADIYDIFDNQERYEVYKNHWKTIMEGRNIHSMLDVSIGSGSVTLPVLDLGIHLSGSDLSSDMLRRCAQKLSVRGMGADLKCCDFRDLSCFQGNRYDLVASTGNSLAYVSNEDVMVALEQMDRLVAEGGYLYFDLRNWDKILRERNRFYLYNPFFEEDMRVNLTQVWDYNVDGSITFNMLYTFEKDNKIIQKEEFDEHYHPISKDLVINKIEELGYKDIEIKCFPAQFAMVDFEKIDWYSVMAHKR